jgi:MFS family permease
VGSLETKNSEGALFYGWWIVGTAFTVQLFMVGFFSYGYPLVIVPVKLDFGASDSQVNLVMTTASIVGLVLPPIVGPLADRWSARGLMLIGTVSLAVAFLLLSITQGIYQFIATFALLIGASNALLGPITCSSVVSRWFVASRGRALGIAATGTSVGGMLAPALLTDWVAAWGWRGTLQGLAAMVLLIVLPLVLFVLRDQPADKGLEPEGTSASAPETGGHGPHSSAEREWTTGEVLRSRSYWVISSALGLLFMSYMAVLSNLGLYVSGLGIEIQMTLLGIDFTAAAILVTLISLFGLIGKIVFGYAADFIGMRPGLWMAQALAGAGIFLLSLEPAFPMMVAAATLIGLAAGGMLPVWGAMVAAAFGTLSYGRVMGLVMPVISVLVMPGFMIAGASSDATGSFALAMQAFVASIGVSAALLLALRLPRPAVA